MAPGCTITQSLDRGEDVETWFHEDGPLLASEVADHGLSRGGEVRVADVGVGGILDAESSFRNSCVS